MAPKRHREEANPASEPGPMKARKGFRVGPENLPDGPWRRKVTKIKKGLIEKAKIKKAYAKIKAAEKSSAYAADGAAEVTDTAEEASDPQIHPERQAMLDDDGEPESKEAQPEAGDGAKTNRPSRPRRQRKPGYYDKALAEAERKKAEAEERRKEMERRTEERNRKIQDRERFRKAMLKAKTPGRDGKRKLGRESGPLLDKVKKMVSEGK